LDVPPPFRVSSLQPSTDTPLESLISGGHFRSAAIKAAQLLTSSGIAPSDHEAIFSLIYTRLSCLTLCNATALAAQEVKALEDLNSSYYLDDLTGAHLAPWELRVLAVRLQGMGFNDARRGVMGYYELGREARLTLTALKKAGRDQHAAEIAMWDARLQDLGLRVASALIEMEDLEGAARHLKTLRVDNGRLRAQQALLWLYLGDVDAARKCIAAGADEQARDVILALACMGDAEYAAAVPIWERLIEAGSGAQQRDDVEIAMYRQNLAVCLLYLGQLSLVRSFLSLSLFPSFPLSLPLREIRNSRAMQQTRTHLESLIDAGHSWRGLTFNLATVYELCTERSRALKISLVERVAGLREEGRGSEGVNGDFKL
jgi:hypothetical protein